MEGCKRPLGRVVTNWRPCSMGSAPLYSRARPLRVVTRLRCVVRSSFRRLYRATVLERLIFLRLVWVMEWIYLSSFSEMTTETQKSVREHCAPQGRRVRGQADQQTHHSTLASKTLYRIKLLPEIYTFYHLRRPPCSFMLLLSTGQQLSDGPFHQNF